MVRQCCVCKRVLRRQSWVEPRPEDLERERVTHGFCEDCYEEYMKSLADLKREILGQNLHLEV